MIKSKNTYIVTALLISVLLLTAMCTCAFWLKAEDQSANADYLDILNDGNSIVNFNQIADWYNDSGVEFYTFYQGSNGYYKVSLVNQNIWWASYGVSNTNLITNHKYYFKADYDVPLNYNLHYQNIDFIQTNISTSDYYFTSLHDAKLLFSFVDATAQNYPLNLRMQLFDLSAMYGLDNEPSLVQCQDIFISDYYSYNTGSIMPINGFEYYSQGVTDTYSNLGLDIVNYSAFSSAYIVSELSGSFPETFIERHVDYEVLDVPFLKARGVLGVPFNSIVNAGSIIKFKYIDPSMGGSGNYLWCGIYYNNSFVPIMRIDSDDTPVDSDGYIIFTCPFDTQTLLFCESSNSSEFVMTTSAFWLGDLQVQNAKMGDIKVLIDSATQDAIYERDEYWQRYYGQFGQGYQTIYNTGYNAGINADAQDFANKYYTIPQFLGALFDVPVQTLTALLDFNVFGFNLKNFVFSLLTLAIIFALIKLILVKTGDK